MQKPVAVSVHKLSVYLRPFRRSSFLECALHPKSAKINKNLLFWNFRICQSYRCWNDWKTRHQCLLW